MCELTLKQAAQFCGGTVAPEYEKIIFTGANYDTRTLEKGELFVALKGARDGHAFAPDAVKNGAAAVLAQQPVGDVPTILVEDTLHALAQIAAGWRRLLPCKVVGITGSVGKTTTKEMTAAVLQTQLRTCKSLKNFNNDIGVPCSVLRIGTDAQAAVIEMGMSHFGDMSRLTAIVQPDIAAIVNIGSMHIEFLGSREGIAKAKLEILEGLTDGGTVLLYGDEPLLRNAALAQTPVFFGLQAGNALRAEQIETGEGFTRFRAVGMGADFPVSLPVEGVHHVPDALAAIAVGLLCGVTPAHIAAGLATFENTGERQRIFTEKGYTIISDCYNAGPESMAAALRVLHARRTTGRRIAVLGDMLELGAHAAQAHRTVGEQAAQLCDAVFACGAFSADVAAGAGEKARDFREREALTSALTAYAKKGDLLLFKGSHGMHMERVLEQFLSNQNVTEER